MPARKQNGCDAALDEILSQSLLPMSASDLDDLIEGVAAAPIGHDPDAWMDLVDLEGDPRLRLPLARKLRTVRDRKTASLPASTRLARVRSILKRRRLAGFVVPRSDEHQGEYVARGSERLAWLTGFTGSAGTAVVLADRAALFVDGRYTEQSRHEVDVALFDIHHMIDEPLHGWIGQHLPAGARLGYDPWLHTSSQSASLTKACARARARAVPVTRNPIDEAWTDRPRAPISPVVPYDARFAGMPSAEKREMIAEQLRRERQDAAIISAPDSVAWLLNVRGGDVPFAPLVLAFAIVTADGIVHLFVDPRKLTKAARLHLGGDVRVLPPDALGETLDRFGSAGSVVRIDPNLTPYWAVLRLQRAGACLVDGMDPCALPKATKNAVEQDGIRAAHVRDGAALCRFLAWLDREAPGGSVTEITAADTLSAMRADNDLYRGASFPTISGAGADGAIVHYRVSKASDRPLKPDTLYLVDSGGQYLDGTTDVTRTVAIGRPNAEVRRRFTQVLKGHIAIASMRFPTGTCGPQLDAAARKALWEDGLDYDHGTGHGVGCYLCVHEGPQRISKLPNAIPLSPGMVLSNEPGYYKPGSYGIRIENLVLVVAAGRPHGGDHELLGFETLTQAPIDLRLVEPELLTASEKQWLDDYHARVRSTIEPLIDHETAAWLKAATRAVTAHGSLQCAVEGSLAISECALNEGRY
jgi:Xaa-Pro aminopeptidase